MSGSGFETLAGADGDEESPVTCPTCGERDAFSVVVHVAPGTQFPDDPDPTMDGERRREMRCCAGCGTVYDPTLAAD